MPRPSLASVRRDQIARAMVHLLARAGVAGASMRALAAETGLTQGLLHHHFRAKEDMIVAALGVVEARVEERLAARAGQDRLDALVDVLLAPEGLAADDAEALAAWGAVGDAARTDPVLRRAWGDALGRLHARLRELLLERAPRLDPAQADALAAAALSQIEGAWRIGTVAPWVLPPGTAAETLRIIVGATLGAGSLPTPAAPRPAPPAPAPRVTLGLRLGSRDRRWFDALVAAAPFPLPDAVWGAIAAAYTTPDRHYHTLEHLVELAGWYREVERGPGWRDPRSVWLALLFHDAVMTRTAGPGEDEARSAALLAALLPDTGTAETLIRLTAFHGARPAGLDPDADHFLDADLAILGAAPRRFARYERQVAAEYAPLLPAEVYRVGRRAFLDRVLAAERVFHSAWFHARLEEQARLNLG